MNSFDILNNVICSSVGGISGEVLTTPIHTIKSRYQNSNNSISNVIGSIHKGGVSGFFVSSKVAIASQVFASTGRYTAYQSLEHAQPFGSLSNKFTHGLVGGLSTTLITHPLELCKIYLQMGSKIGPEIKEKGLFVLYRGYSKSLASSSVGSMSLMPLYHLLEEKTDNPILSSILSATISAILIQPIDYMGTRQAYSLPFWEGVSLIYFKGLSLNLLRIVPHFTISMAVLRKMKCMMRGEENLGREL